MIVLPFFRKSLPAALAIGTNIRQTTQQPNASQWEANSLASWKKQGGENRKSHVARCSHLNSVSCLTTDDGLTGLARQGQSSELGISHTGQGGTPSEFSRRRMTIGVKRIQSAIENQG